MAILVPVIGKARSASKRTVCQSNLKQIDLAMRVYIQNNDETYPCAEDPISITPFYWLWMGRGFCKYIKPYIGSHIDANNPSVLLCPEDKVAPTNWESTSYSYSMAFYHSPAQIDDMNSIADTYSFPVDSVPQRMTSVAHPAKKIIIGEWLSNHLRLDDTDSGWWCWEGRRNFLFADGHVSFIKAEDILKANCGYPNPNLTKGGIKGIDWQAEN